jgi:signal transduction histidine kinase
MNIRLLNSSLILIGCDMLIGTSALAGANNVRSASIVIQSILQPSLIFAVKTTNSPDARKSAKISSQNSAQCLNRLLKKAKKDYVKGNYPSSLKNALTVEKLASRLKNDSVIADAGNMIALIYMAQEQFLPAFPYLQKAAAINKRIGNLFHLAANQVNLSLYYSNTHQIERAINYADSSLNLSIKIGAANLEAMSANHLGNNYLLIGERNKALKYYQRVLGNKRYQDDWENCFANTGLARLYLSEKDYAKAIKFGMEGFKLAKMIGTKWDAQQSSQILYQAYHQAGNQARAFEYLNLFKLYSDSLFNEKKEVEINFLLLKKKEAENLYLERKNLSNEQQHKITQMIIVIVSLVAVFLLTLVTLLFKRNARNRKYNKALQLQLGDIQRKSILIDEQNLNLNQLNYTKDQLFSIIGHDLRSPFSSILGTLELFQSGDLEPEDIRDISGKFHEQVSVTAKMLDNLLLWGSSQLGGMKADIRQIELEELTNEVLSVFGEVAGRKNITIITQPISSSSILADPDQVKVIIQNLLANAVKFTKPGGEIEVSYHQTQEKMELVVRDNGLGMSPSTLHQLLRYGGKKVSTYGTAYEKGVGLGLLLVKEFAEQNGATIQVQSTEDVGTTFFIGFRPYLAGSD